MINREVNGYFWMTFTPSSTWLWVCKKFIEINPPYFQQYAIFMSQHHLPILKTNWHWVNLWKNSQVHCFLDQDKRFSWKLFLLCLCRERCGQKWSRMSHKRQNLEWGSLAAGKAWKAILNPAPGCVKKAFCYISRLQMGRNVLHLQYSKMRECFFFPSLYYIT